MYVKDRGAAMASPTGPLRILTEETGARLGQLQALIERLATVTEAVRIPPGPTPANAAPDTVARVLSGIDAGPGLCGLADNLDEMRRLLWGLECLVDQIRL